MFRRIQPDGQTVSFTFEGRPMVACAGDTIAAALLAGGVTSFRTSAVSGEKRAPYCLMGVCFECLVDIDDARERQACLTPVREGMAVSISHVGREP